MIWVIFLIRGILYESRWVIVNFSFFVFFGVNEIVIVMELRIKFRNIIICVGRSIDFLGWVIKFKLFKILIVLIIFSVYLWKLLFIKIELLI